MHCDLLLFIPECERNVLIAVGITDTSDAIFAPSVCSLSGLIVGEVYETVRPVLLSVHGYLRAQASPSAE